MSDGPVGANVGEIRADRKGPLLTLVVAASLNRVIGRGGELVWRIADDMKWFKAVTMGKPVIMGRKTFESIGRALPGRANIVISTRCDFNAENAHVAPSLEAALAEARNAALSARQGEIAILGGGEVYRQTIERADRLYYTQVHAEVEGDAFFPEFDHSAYRKVRVSSVQRSPKNDHACDFFIMDRR